MSRNRNSIAAFAWALLAAIPSTGVTSAQPGSISAPNGLAVGGSIRDSKITLGYPPAEFRRLLQQQSLSEKQRQQIADLRHKLDVSADALAAFFRILRENNVPPEQLENRLVDIAVDYRATKDQVRPNARDSPAVMNLKQQANVALDSGRFEDARTLFDNALSVQQAAAAPELDQLAQTNAQLGDLAMTQLHYIDAAAFFAKAAGLVSNGDGRRGYLDRQVGALFRQGNERADNAALQQVITICGGLLSEHAREREPSDWARTQVSLGTALVVLGERESSPAHLAAAVSAFNAALTVYTLKGDPFHWANTQDSLGNALESLGERFADTAAIVAAVSAFNEALRVYAREGDLVDWAGTQNNLGMALKALGEQTGDRNYFNRAVTAFQNALTQITRERSPLKWAAIQDNLGNALVRCGESEANKADLDLAVTAFENALLVNTRERVPPDWASTQNNLGIALTELSEHEGGTAHLEQAVSALNDALRESTREFSPPKWAQTQNNLGRALARLGKRERGKIGMVHLQAAKAAFAAALPEFELENSFGQAALVRAALNAVDNEIQKTTGSPAPVRPSPLN